MWHSLARTTRTCAKREVCEYRVQEGLNSEEHHVLFPLPFPFETKGFSSVLRKEYECSIMRHVNVIIKYSSKNQFSCPECSTKKFFLMHWKEIYSYWSAQPSFIHLRLGVRSFFVFPSEQSPWPWASQIKMLAELIVPHCSRNVPAHFSPSFFPFSCRIVTQIRSISLQKIEYLMTQWPEKSKKAKWKYSVKNIPQANVYWETLKGAISLDGTKRWGRFVCS